MNTANTTIDAGKPFDFGKTAADYAKYRDIYPAEFFCPYGLYDRKPGKTRNTATIHRFSGSWLPYKRRLLNTSRKILGKKAYMRIRKSLKGKHRTAGGKPCR